MNTIDLEPQCDDDERRRRLFDGQLLVFQPRPASRGLCDLALKLSRAAFAPHDPRTAQYEMPVERYVEILAELKPKFIHHPQAKVWIRELLDDFGCSLDRTCFDVPRLRTVTHGGYLTSGLGYAYHPHRDTWYSAPHSQLNWWLPLHELSPTNTVVFHPRYWDEPLRNNSHEYDYEQWKRGGRREARQQVRTDRRKQPRPQEPLDSSGDLHVLCPPGGIVLFSGAHVHSTATNTSGVTRLSIDFRTVHLDDVEQQRGAPNLDCRCTGTTLGDFLRARDFASMFDAAGRPATPAVAEPCADSRDVSTMGASEPR